MPSCWTCGLIGWRPLCDLHIRMKLFFDLSALPPWERDVHTAAWERALSHFPGEHAKDGVTFNRRNADVVIRPGSPGFYDAPLKTILGSLREEEVRTIVWDWGDVPLGRMSGFYCSLTERLFDPKRHRTMSYPVVFNEFVEEYPQEDARHNFGFVGGLSAGVRQRLIDMYSRGTAHGGSVRVQAANWSTIFEASSIGRKLDYADSLRQARFVLCPRGAGVGSIRLFETMKAGRVPIIISDGYILPSGIDWNRCSVRVRERDIADIPRIVEARLMDWPAMAYEARRVWHEHFSPTAVFPYLVGQLKDLLPTLPELSMSYQLRYSTGVATELTRQYARPVLGAAKATLFRRRRA